MDEKAAAARREYKRQWAKANPDKIRAQQERYWKKKAEQAEQEKQPEQANPEDREEPATEPVWRR